jgi:hypothetical protein
MSEIAAHESKNARGEVAVVFRSAENGIRGDAATRKVVRGIQGRLGQSDLIVERLAVRGESRVEICGFAISARQSETQIYAACPVFEQVGMESLLVLGLLIGGTYRRHSGHRQL